MKLTPHYVPFIRSAPPKVQRALGLAALTSVLACAASAAALTVDEQRVAQSG